MPTASPRPASQPLGALRAGRLPGVERIAVLHARGLGDLVFALPALEALRAAYPSAEITLLGAPWYAALLADRPIPVDRVVAVPPSPGVNGSPAAWDGSSLERFFAEQGSRRYDLAVQLQGGGRHSNPFVLRLGAHSTVGAATADAPPLDRVTPFFHYQHEVLRCLEVVALAGARPVRIEPTLAVTEADLAEAARVVPPGPGPLVAVHPGAGDPRRRWPTERFAEVGCALVAAGARVVVTGTERERSLVEDLVARMDGQAVDLCSRLSLPGLVGVLSSCALVVSNDSGPLHLAQAVGSDTVGLYWCGNVITAAPFTRHRHRVVISWQLECPVCGLDCTEDDCPHDDSFLQRVSAEEVCGHALDLLNRTP